MRISSLLQTVSLAAVSMMVASLARAQTLTDFGSVVNVNGVNAINVPYTGSHAIGDTVFLRGGIDSGVAGGGAPILGPDTKGNVFTIDVVCAANGGVESQSFIAHSTLTASVTTSDHIPYTAAGGATPFGSIRGAATTTAILALDGIPKCASVNTGIPPASGGVTSKVNGIAVGSAIGKNGNTAYTVQSTGFTTLGSLGGGNYGPFTGGYEAYTGVNTLSYQPTALTQTQSSSSALVFYRTQALPLIPGNYVANPGLVGFTTNRELDVGCLNAPPVAAALGECLQVQAIRPGEWRTDLIDKGVTYASGYSGYFDQCLGQNGTTGAAATTLNGTNGSVGNGSGAYQANMGPGTCKGANLVGFIPGGGAYFRVHASWTAQSVSGTWQAPLWLNGGQCSPLPVVVGCNWTNQQTVVTISTASYVSATGIASFVTASAPTFGAFTSVTLGTNLTGTGAFASLQGVSCEALTSITTTSFNLTCPSGLGVLALTGGSIGPTYFHYPEFDIEMFQGNFGDPLGQLQMTFHDWYNAAKSGNYATFFVSNPGQSSFSTPHYYDFQWTPAVGSTPGTVSMYYDNTLVGTQSWKQFTNNGTQAAPTDYTLGTPFCSYASGTGVITCTTAATHSIVVGSSPHLNITAGMGSTSTLDGNWPALSGTTGTTVILQGPSGAGTVTITAGDIAQEWAFGIADIQNFLPYMGCSNTTPCTIDDEEIWQSPTQFLQSLRF